MGIYNPFTKVKNAKRFSDMFVDSFYKKYIERDEYDVYVGRTSYSKYNETLYVIKEENLGKRLYSFIFKLRELKDEILTEYLFFIDKVVVNKKEKRIIAFYLKSSVEFRKDYVHFNETIRQLIEFLKFVKKVFELGFAINNYIFYDQIDKDILLAFVKYEESEKDNAKKGNFNFLARFIHYNLFGETLDKVLGNNYGILKFSPDYSLSKSLMKIFYDCYNFKAIDYDFVEDFKYALYEYPLSYNNKVIISDISFKKNSEVIEENEVYTIYNIRDSSIILFKNPDEKTRKVFEDNIDCLPYKINYVIFDIEKSFLGFEFSNLEYYNKKKVVDILFSNDFNDINILEFNKFIQNMWKLSEFLNDLSLKDGDINEKSIDDVKEIIYLDNSISKFTLKNFKALLDISEFTINSSKLMLIKLAFDGIYKYVKVWCNENLVKIDDIDENTIYLIEAIKYMPPNFVKEFLNFILKRKVNYDLAYTSFFIDFKNNNTLKNKILVYESFAEFFDIGFVFYENVIKDHNINIVEGTFEYKLDNETSLFLVSYENECKKVINNIYINCKVLSENNVFYDRYLDELKYTTVCNVVYSKEIINNEYRIKGYIGSVIKDGISVWNYDFSKTTNKDFIKMFKHFFRFMYGNVCISPKCVKISKDLTFSIDLRENDNLVYVGRNYYYRDLFPYLRIPGLDFDFWESYYKGKNSHYELEMLYNSLDSYCEIHKCYYESKDCYNSQKPILCPICQKTNMICDDFNEVIFEDEYATHYELEDDLCVKVYKNDVVDLSLQSKVIDLYLSEDIYLEGIQNDFIPVKKALNSKKEFIGYVYKKVDMSTCYNLQTLTNLKRVKSIYILCKQVLELKKQGIAFVQNPCNSIFFNKNYKNQVQILNIDLIQFLTGQYENEILASDSYFVEFFNDSITKEMGIDKVDTNNINDLVDEIKYLIINMNKRCNIHGIYYNKEFTVCPICLPEFSLSTIQDNIKKMNINVINQILKYEGGESYLFDYSEDGTSDDILKIFKADEVDMDFKLVILCKLLRKRKVLESEELNACKFSYIIPKKLVFSDGSQELKGYYMKEIPDAYPIITLRDKNEVEKLNFDLRDVLEILITIGEGIEYLHNKAGVYIGDFNGKNILFDIDKKVYFLDFDGMGVDDVVPIFFTEGYANPIAWENKAVTMHDDWYSFAIHTFYYLTFVHPFNGIYLDENGNNMNVVQRMKNGISVLGNHSVKVPQMARSWDWMDKDLIEAFIRIFENGSKENITPILKKLYDSIKLIEEPKSSKNSLEIRSIDYGASDVKRIINDISYISLSDTLNILRRNTIVNLKLSNVDEILDVKLSINLTYAYVIYDKAIIVFYFDKMQEPIFKKDFTCSTRFVVNDTTLYYNDVMRGINVIVKVDFKYGKVTEISKIDLRSDMLTKEFLVVNREKFVAIKSDGKMDFVFCNDINYLKLDEQPSTKYKILYDKVSTKWLVVNDKGKYIVIKSNGENIISRNEELLDCNLENIAFVKGNIYIPKNGYVHIINPKKFKTKRIECKESTINSKLVILENGFKIFTTNLAYEYVNTKNS